MSTHQTGRYQGRKALITGGTTGIGLATAEHLQHEGARVIVTGQTQAGVEAARAHLGPEATVVVSDAGSLEDIAHLENVIARNGALLDLVHLNAGISHTESVTDMTPEIYDRIMAVNTRGPYFTIQRLTRHIRPGGAIVLTTSGSAVLGMAGDSAYAASKAALRSMTRTFARELLSAGIRVNAVSPGPIATRILDRTRPGAEAAAIRDGIAATHPMGRLGQPDEVARAVAFLAFEATYTTGASLDVDGGATTL